MMAMEELDGRRLRRRQNRESVVQAMLDLYAEGDYQPNAAQIAERAGISPRSLFRYFDDVDDLNRAAIERNLAEAEPFVDPGIDPAATLDTRISQLVDGRLRLFERMAPGLRAARASAHRQPVVGKQVHQARSFMRRQLRPAFAAELGGRRSHLLPAVDALTSFETYELLRDQRLSRPDIVATLTAALTALLRPDGGPT